MVNSEAGSSSDGARASGGEYQVFLNFRGLDTRYVFTDFLYQGLIDAGVRVFRDNEELRVGEVIGGNLLRAIDNSKIYIPIFSQTYASSKWCLRELAHIVKNVSKSESQKSILPIFLDVEPEDVKLKTPRYNNALLEHEKNFPVEVEEWRKALAEVDEIKGWNVKKDESQATIVKLVVERVLEELKLKQRLVPEHLVGLDDRVKHLTGLLDVNHRDVRLIGIYGMGGIGKTTIAKVVFNELLCHFGKCSSFLENVREKMLTEDGIVQLQKKLLSDIVDSRSAEGVQDIEQGMRRIGEVLSMKMVLVVLDDVDNKDHIKRLIGNNSLHLGSRIIITTRNKTILQGQEFKDEIIPYEMLKMDNALAIELFCRHAFGKTFPLDDYHALSSEIVLRTGGLPLAVEVIGSLLNKKDKAFWEETKIKLRNVPEVEIMEKLRISYDDLNEHEQQIFLDIACFFFNEKKTDAIYMWADCDFYPVRGIDVLTNRCLIKILDNDQFWMHDQLIEMGRRIVHQESPNDPSKRSRVWIAKETLEIIRTEERKNEVEALEIEGSHTEFIDITNEEFEKFPNLRFLKLKLASFTGDFARCHSKLKWISLHYPSDFIIDVGVDNIHFNDLVVFKLYSNYFSDDSKAWDLMKGLRKLKVLSLKYCNCITTIPNFSECLELERLTIAFCKSLKKIESFIRKLQSLIELKIEWCWILTDLPNEVGALGKLECFSLQGCSKLRELPGSLGNLTSLKELDLADTRISELPNSLGNLTSLKELDLAHTRIRELPNSLGNLTSLKELNLTHTSIRELPNSIGKLKSLCVLHFVVGDRENHAWHLPRSIGMLTNLEKLDLSGHKGLKGEIPYGIEGLSSLKILKLNSTGICRILGKIDMLCHLQMVDLLDCHDIQELPKFPTSLTCLRIQSESLLSVPDLSYLTRLDELLLSNSKFAREGSKLITGCNLCWIEGLSKLKKLTLCLLGALGPLELASHDHLEFLDLAALDLKPLMRLPSATSSWKYLQTLWISHCEVEDILLEGFPQLEELNVHSCIRLQRLFILSKLLKLRQVSVSLCQELVEIRVVDLSESLKILRIHYCESLKRISGLLYLKNLEKLKISICNVLTNVEGLDELESLKYLTVTLCMSLERLIDASCTKIPDNCIALILSCGDHVKNFGLFQREPLLKSYKELILQMDHSFTIRFQLGVRKPSEGFEFAGGILREKKGVSPDSVTYKGLIADVKGFGFRTKRMWYETPFEFYELIIEIKSDEQVKGMAQLASKRGLIHLYVEGGVDSEWEGEYDDEMMEMLREEWRMKIDVYSDEDGAEWDVSGPDEYSDFASVDNSETDGTSSIDDFQSEPGDAKCFEDTGNRRQMRDGRIRHHGSVARRKTARMENRKKDNDESWEPANQNDVLRSSCQRCKGAEHDEKSCKATTEVEDQRHLSHSSQLKSTSAKQGKRQRDDDHASPTDTTTKNSTCGQRSGIPQHVTRRTRRQAAKIQPPVEEAALPVEAVGPSRKRKRNDSKQANPIRRSARLMKGATGGTADVVHID